MRLIDADKIDFNEAFVGASEFAQDTRNAAQMLINNQSTAFDVDEVVRRIKDIKDKEYTACSGPECGYCRYLSTCSYEDKAGKLALEKAIEIVKGGGN